MRRTVGVLMVAVILVVMSAGLFVWSGVYNIAASSPAVLKGLKDEVMARWNPEQLKEQVLASQARRQYIKELPDALQPVWDYQASVDDTKRFVRRGSARIIKVKKRWPAIAEVKG